MLKILHIELLKLNRFANYILVIVVLVFGAIGTFTEISILKDWDKAKNSGVIPVFFAGITESLLILLAVFVCLNIGREYGENTLRRITIEGYKRHQFFAGKLAVVVGISLLLFLISIGQLAIAGSATGHSEDLKDFFTTQALISGYVKLLYTGLFAFFLVFVLRSTAAGIILYISWSFVEPMIKAVQQFVIDRKSWHFELYHNLPLASIHLVVSQDEIVKTGHVFVAGLYLLLFMLIPYLLFETRDIK